MKTIFVNDNAVSVFYPADPGDCKKRKKWLEYPYSDFTKNASKAVGWMVALDVPFWLVATSWHRL